MSSLLNSEVRTIVNLFTVKKVKTFTGTDGYGVSCDVYLGKTNLGEYLDVADGGEVTFFAKSKESRQLFIDTLNNNKWGELMLTYDYSMCDSICEDLLISSLIELCLDLNENNKLITKYSKKGIVYGVPFGSSIKSINYKITLEELKKLKGGVEDITKTIETVVGKLEKGQMILNQNLDDLNLPTSIKNHIFKN